ncbi:hypothetical protein ACS0TY_001704 [Phlomoides rotata]
MDSFNFHDIRVEKANAISRYQRIQRITTLFRFIELLLFLIIVSRISVDQYVSRFNLLGEYIRGISVALISPQFVFLIGNAIVIVLFLKSRRFSATEGEKTTDLYEEYVEKCQMNHERKALDAYQFAVCNGNKKMHRSNSEKLERIKHGVERRRELTRSKTERCRKNPDCENKLAATDEMSSEEFRRAVEAFIARQQRFLREE